MKDKHQRKQLHDILHDIQKSGGKMPTDEGESDILDLYLSPTEKIKRKKKDQDES
jgi:hypothetical protein